MKKLFSGLLSLFLLAGCATSATQESGYQQITMAEALVMMEESSNYIILDIRTPAEFSDKHIPNAVNVPNENIGTAAIPELPDKEQLIFI